MEKKVINLELSKALKEAGALQESDWAWWHNLRRNRWELSDDNPYSENDMYACEEHYNKDCSAFDCHELFERLPDFIHATHMLTLRKWVRHGKEDVTFYQAFYMGSNMDILLGKMMQEKTPAEALGKLHLWCLESGRCKEQNR